jgi:hypothetical protein
MTNRTGGDPQIVWAYAAITPVRILKLGFQVAIGLTDFYIVGNYHCKLKSSLKQVHAGFWPFSLVNSLSVPSVLLADRYEREGDIVAFNMNFIWGAAFRIAAREV